jgi:hypothetical protein
MTKWKKWLNSNNYTQSSKKGVSAVILFYSLNALWNISELSSREHSRWEIKSNDLWEEILALP